jgi:hypothetical protein
VALSALDAQHKRPDEHDLALVLGPALAHWNELVRWLESSYDQLAFEWGCAGKKYGWSQRVIQRKRTIVYLIPGQGHFLAGLVLGDRAVQEALAAGLSEQVRLAIEGAPRYAEGTGFRLPVASADDLADIQKLVAIKIGS